MIYFKMRKNFQPLSETRNPSNWSSRDIWMIKDKFLIEHHIYYKEKLYFVAKKSQIDQAGFGLYAGRDFKKNTVIAYYEGRTMVEKVDNMYDYTGFLKTYGNQEFNKWIKTELGGYVMQINNKWIDGSKDNFNGTGFINDVYKSGFKVNLKLNNRGGFKTLRDIKEGEELFFQYSRGNTYWK